jgi:hypothetical protein
MTVESSAALLGCNLVALLGCLMAAWMAALLDMMKAGRLVGQLVG